MLRTIIELIGSVFLSSRLTCSGDYPFLKVDIVDTVDIADIARQNYIIISTSSDIMQLLLYDLTTCIIFQFLYIV